MASHAQVESSEVPGTSLAEQLAGVIRVFPDFPSAGVLFQDLAGVYAAPQLMRATGAHLADAFAGKVDAILAVEARGFVVGTAVALAADRPLLLARKAGKLPGATHDADYQLEYGLATLQIQRGTLARGQRVLIVDDVLATGGTLTAAASLVERVDAQVTGFAVVLELAMLDGRSRLAPRRLVSGLTVGTVPPVDA
ncbi:adenine phosphoribosyltransferase [Micromonospora sp. Llam7]|uniref:adenine phosphoribosyltransferase n=1 Tax=Micromonospora tarapacensis TaxID=2835305 RepID=UPI001C834CA8|nr:adenine phosphoribosyltransferase [Micromonospora tarapacensis]MBX7265765.1 adenine phosphoribosyltransferase [Micromonospora tarapacensis]